MTMRPPLMACRFVAGSLLVACVTFAVPANAGRWHNLEPANGVEGRIDLDSLQREGSNVTYRAEFTMLRPNSNTKRAISTAVIDCDKGQRKGLVVEQFLSDGTSRKGSIDTGWKAIRAGSITAKVRELVCGRPS